MIGGVKDLRAAIAALCKIVLMNTHKDTVLLRLNQLETFMDVAHFTFSYRRQRIVANRAILFSCHLDTVSGRFQKRFQLQCDRKINVFFKQTSL